MVHLRSEETWSFFECCLCFAFRGHVDEAEGKLIPPTFVTNPFYQRHLKSTQERSRRLVTEVSAHSRLARRCCYKHEERFGNNCSTCKAISKEVNRLIESHADKISHFKTITTTPCYQSMLGEALDDMWQSQEIPQPWKIAFPNHDWTINDKRLVGIRHQHQFYQLTKNGEKPFPDKLRFITCKSLAQKVPCPYEKNCIFAHSKDELRKYGPRDKANARLLKYSVEGITFTATKWQRKQNCALVEGEDLDSDESNIGENEYDMDALTMDTMSDRGSDEEMFADKIDGNTPAVAQLTSSNTNWLVSLPYSDTVKAYNAGG